MSPQPALNHLGRLYFLHIPKAAGTSLRLWLESLFDVEACYPHYHPYEVPDDPEAELVRHQFFTGHHRWRFAETWGNRLGLAVITFLRSPAHRSLSELRYQRSFTPEQAVLYRDRTWVKGWILDLLDDMSDETIARLPRYVREVGDEQARHLGFTATLESPDAGRGNYLTGDVDEAVLASALDHLRGMAAFGLVEHMDRSALLLADGLGLPALPMTVKANVSAEGCNEPEASLLEAVADANAFDARLYRAACEIFEDRWAALLARFGLADDAEGRLALVARLDEAFRTTDRGLPRLATLTADPSRGMMVDGWKPRFHYPPLDRWLRWSQTARPRLWLPIDRSSERALRIEIAYTTDDIVRDGFVLEIDGEPVDVERNYALWPEDGNHHLVLTAAIPPAPDLPQYTEIAFRLPPGKEDGALALSGITVSEAASARLEQVDPREQSVHLEQPAVHRADETGL